MILFKNKEFIGGDLLDIIYFNDIDNVTNNNWWDNPLKEESWILEIPKDLTKLDFYNTSMSNIHFIPRISESDDHFYDVFWNSNETYVFDCYYCAMDFMGNYEGDFKTEVEELYERILESELVDETIWQYSNLDDLAKEFDVDFMNELEVMVYSMDITMDSVLNSMKLFMLDKYRARLVEQRLSRLN